MSCIELTRDSNEMHDETDYAVFAPRERRQRQKKRGKKVKKFRTNAVDTRYIRYIQRGVSSPFMSSRTASREKIVPDGRAARANEIKNKRKKKNTQFQNPLKKQIDSAF